MRCLPRLQPGLVVERLVWLRRFFVPVSGFVGRPSAKIPCLDEKALRPIGICLLSPLLDAHHQAILGEIYMLLLHFLGRLIRNIIDNDVDSIAGEGEESEQYDENEQREKLGEGGHDDCVV